MPPSTSKTVVLEEGLVLRKRVLSSDPNPIEEDANNNVVEGKEYKIDDINYLRSEKEKPAASKREASEETKPDYSNWKAEIR